MAQAGRDFSWVAWLGAAGVLLLGWLAFSQGDLQPKRLESDVESRASLALSKAGFGWARLDVHDRVGELLGEAPNEDQRVAAYEAARQLLSPYMGLPGVFSELDNRLRVKAPPPIRLVAPLSTVAAPASPEGATSLAALTAPPVVPPKECLDALNSAVRAAPIRFRQRSAELAPGARPAIRRLVQVIRRCDPWRLVVEGYPDANGSDQSNRKLVQRRAVAVAAALLIEGAPVGQLALQTEDGRLKTPGVDEAGPPAAATSRSQRRVEFHLVASVNG